MAASEMVSAQVVGQVSYTDLRPLIEHVNKYVRYQKCDIEVRISFVESPAKGEYLTEKEVCLSKRTHACTANPSVIILFLEY